MAAGPRRTKSRKQATAQTFDPGAILFILVGASIAYFVAIWPTLPEAGSARWITTAAFFAAASLLGLASVLSTWVGGRLHEVLDVPLAAAARLASRGGAFLARWGRRSGDFLIFVVLVGGVIAAAINLKQDDKVFALKLFCVLYFSLLPAVLYLQFSSRRALTVWREYVLNLFQLHIDDYAHLPRPPTLSRFHEPWRRAREQAWRRAHGLDGGTDLPLEDARNLEKANIYRRKFQDLFGPLPEEEPRSIASLRSPHKLQVAMSTVLIAIGWVFVVQPETLFGSSFTPSDFHLAGLPTIPRETISFAFLGSYFYILQMLVRRFFQNDLKATAFLSATMRIIIVTLLVWTIDPLLQGQTSQAWRSALAFVIGVFPSVGWQALTQVLVKKPLQLGVKSLQSDYPLSDLDGLNIWYESRLLEEGIEDMQNLATADLVDVMLNTRLPVERLVDWVDQALLYLHVAKEDRPTLRRYGIRAATDLLDAFSEEQDSRFVDKRFRQELERLLNRRDGADDENASVMRSILTTLATERNLQYVLSWKSFKSDTASVFPATSSGLRNGAKKKVQAGRRKPAARAATKQ
jgi:hypothetical protein